MDAIIEELLRYLCPVQMAFPRFARQDLDLFGQRVGRGDVVVVSLTGANRDPRHTPDPDLFTPPPSRRTTSPSATACTAASAPSSPAWSCGPRWSAWRRRFPDLTVPAPDEVSFRELSVVHSIDALPVELA